MDSAKAGVLVIAEGDCHATANPSDAEKSIMSFIVTDPFLNGEAIVVKVSVYPPFLDSR